MDKATVNAKSSSGENIMRKVIEPQMKLGEQAIADIKLDPKSHDDIPQILRGLQHIYVSGYQTPVGASGITRSFPVKNMGRRAL